MTVRMKIDDYDISAAARGTKTSFELLLGTGIGSVEDRGERESESRDIPLPVLQIAGAAEGPTLLVLAGVHGDEYEGMETILRLYRGIQPERMAGTLVLAPVANPLSYRGGTRTSPEDGLNMARVFPGDRWGRPTERIAWQLHHRLLAQADFLLDLHSGGTHYAISTLVGYYHNEETEIGRKSRAAAEAFGAELLWAHETVAPGRTVSSALALGVPWLYTEAYGGKRIRREDAELYYRGALRLMRHLGMVTGVPEQTAASRADLSSAPVRRIFGDGNFDGSETAGASGFFLPETVLGAEISAGERIGSICGFDGTELERVVASRDGIVVMLPGAPTVRQGEPLFLIAPTELQHP